MTRAPLQQRLADVAIAGVLLLLYAVAFVSFFSWNDTNPDVDAYWEAGLRMRRGEAIYAPPDGRSTKAYLYPPAFAAGFAPLTLLPPVWGYALWMGSHFLLLAALVRTVARATGLDPGGRPYRLLLCATLLVPVVSELQEGQTNLLLVTLTAAGLLFVEEGRPRTGGLLLAAASHLKVVPAVIVLPLLAAGRRRAAAWMLAGGVLLALLPALWTVPSLGLTAGLARCVSLHVEFARQIVGPALSSGTVAGVRQFYVLNNSLSAAAHRLFGRVEPSPFSSAVEEPLLFVLPRPWLVLGPLVLASAMLVAALLLSRRTAGDRPGRVAGAALALVTAQIGGLNFWEHHLVSVALLIAPLTACRIRLAAALGAPLMLALTAPYLLQHAPLPWVADLGRRWISASRTWGAPTAAVLVLWAGCFAVYWRRGRPAEIE